jgi:prepilin-type N-terminal cleavage/methylation domain-containing protein
MNRARRGFTLVEIMIVVIIIGLLLAIAAPGYQTIRTRSRSRAVLGDLMRISNAKDQFTMNAGLSNGTSINDATDLVPVYLQTWPTGPVTGSYSANAVGEEPTFNGNNSAWYVQHCEDVADSSCTL